VRGKFDFHGPLQRRWITNPVSNEERTAEFPPDLDMERRRGVGAQPKSWLGRRPDEDQPVT